MHALASPNGACGWVTVGQAADGSGVRRTHASIFDAAARADRWLEGVRDKVLHPFFVDSTDGVPDDAPIVHTSERSDEWVTRGPRCR